MSRMKKIGRRYLRDYSPQSQKDNNILIGIFAFEHNYREMILIFKGMDNIKQIPDAVQKGL